MSGSQVASDDGVGELRVYVRWQVDEPRLVKHQPPLDPSSPCVDWQCPQCLEPLGTELPISLVALGPDEEEQRARFLARRWFTCWAMVLHSTCAVKLTAEELVELALKVVSAFAVAAARATVLLPPAVLGGAQQP